MNLIADENLDAAIVDRLRAEGHAVVWVADLAPGVTDRQGQVHSGVMLIRLAGVARVQKAEIVAEVLRERAGDLYRGFTVVTPGQVWSFDVYPYD